VPGQLRVDTHDLIRLPDDELLSFWQQERQLATSGDLYSARGWYHEKYLSVMKGQNLVDFGSGFGFDSLSFAEVAEQVTCVDIVPENLEVINRVARLLGRNNVTTSLVTGLESFQSLPENYDVLLAQGSLHHAPAHVVIPEIQALAGRLRPGGRWLQLAYPHARWVREGCLPFHHWGKVTDGAATPWAEWLDLDTVITRMSPLEFDTLESFEFHNGEFIWFDLMKRSSPRVMP
jgi:SAM-dependent methyltransferase